MFRSSIKRQYLRWRETNHTLNHRIVSTLTRDDLHDGARNLGLLHGRTLVFDNETAADILMDHCIYDLRRRDRRNAVERFANSNAELSDDERRALEQMQDARFRMLLFTERPRTLSFEVTDVFGLEQIKLIDIGLSHSAREGGMLVGHTIRTGIEDAWATTGAMLSIGADDAEEIIVKLESVIPRNTKTLKNLTPQQWSSVARISFRTALKNGGAEFVELRHPADPRPSVPMRTEALWSELVES